MIITQTPLRISFGGGGTDFPDYYNNSKKGGQVLSTTIDKYIYVLVKKRFDKKIVAHYRKTEMCDHLDELEHGIIRECLRWCGPHSQIEVSPTADIPGTGTGLGSSSSLTIGLLNALYTYIGLPQTKAKLAENACKIETDILKQPIGKQDQYAAAYGGLHIIKFHPDLIQIQPIGIAQDTLEELEQNLLLFYTRMVRRSSEILSEQKRNIPDKISILSEMRDIVDLMEIVLMKSNFESFAILLNEGWKLKQRLAKTISNPEINDIYHLGLKAGALGGKLCGAGGGGFILFYCPYERQKKLRQALNKLYELPFHFEKDGTKIIFNIRRD